MPNRNPLLADFNDDEWDLTEQTFEDEPIFNEDEWDLTEAEEEPGLPEYGDGFTMKTEDDDWDQARANYDDGIGVDRSAMREKVQNTINWANALGMTPEEVYSNYNQIQKDIQGINLDPDMSIYSEPTENHPVYNQIVRKKGQLYQAVITPDVGIDVEDRAQMLAGLPLYSSYARNGYGVVQDQQAVQKEVMRHMDGMAAEMKSSSGKASYAIKDDFWDATVSRYGLPEHFFISPQSQALLLQETAGYFDRRARKDVLKALGLRERQVVQAYNKKVNIKIPSNRIIRGQGQVWWEAVKPHLRLTPESVVEAPRDFSDFAGPQAERFAKLPSSAPFADKYQLWSDRYSATITSKLIGTAGGFMDAVAWLTDGAVGQETADLFADFAEFTAPPDPTFGEQVAGGFASTVAFFIPGIGVARGAQLFARVSQRLAGWAGASTMAAGEAMTEAGMVHRELLAAGASRDRADIAARFTFWANLPVLLVTDKLGFFGDKGRGILGELKKRGVAGVLEGTQESTQGIISSKAKDESIKWKDVLHEGVIGAIIGAVMGGGLGQVDQKEGPLLNDNMKNIIGRHAGGVDLQGEVGSYTVMTANGIETYTDYQQYMDQGKPDIAVTPESIQSLLDDGQIDQGVADMAVILMDKVEDFGINDTLALAQQVRQATDEEMIRHGEEPQGPLNKTVLGEMELQVRDQVVAAAIKLYKGHDVDTLVEEWMHRSWFTSLTDAQRDSYLAYHEASDRKNESVEEHFAQEGRDYFFMTGKHKATGKKLRTLFKNSIDGLLDLVRRIRSLHKANIPPAILNVYEAASAGGYVTMAEGNSILAQAAPHQQLRDIKVKVLHNRNFEKRFQVFTVSNIDMKKFKHEKHPDDQPIKFNTPEQAHAYNSHPERVKDWHEIYEAAENIPVKIQAKGKPGTASYKKKNIGKLEDVMILGLTTGCQRQRATVERVANGVLPKSTELEACYGKICWANFTSYAKIYANKTFENMDVQDLTLTTKENIRTKFFKKNGEIKKDFVDYLNEQDFLRMGYYGDDSHAIATDLALEWLKTCKEAGVTTETIFITAGYAPVTTEQYAALVPYNDLYEIHVSQSGWFSKNEGMLRMGEFMAARNVGANVKMRVITNVDHVSELAFDNHDWMMDLIFNKMKIPQSELLETPYHDDTHEGKGARSEPAMLFENVCCETGKCKTCKVGCMKYVPSDNKPKQIQPRKIKDAATKPHKTKKKYKVASDKITAQQLRRHNLWPAVRYPDTGRIKSTKNETSAHGALFAPGEDYGQPFDYTEDMGYVDESGKFYNRLEAQKLVGLKPSKSGLESGVARKIRQGVPDQELSLYVGYDVTGKAKPYVSQMAKYRQGIFDQQLRDLNLRLAIRHLDKNDEWQIYHGKPGEIHSMVMVRVAEETDTPVDEFFMDAENGFTYKGKFYDRQQTAALMAEHDESGMKMARFAESQDLAIRIQAENDLKPMPVRTTNPAGLVSAEFGFWQEIPGEPSVAFYTIFGGDFNHSSVGVQRLQELEVPVPYTPDPPEVTRSLPSLETHFQIRNRYKVAGPGVEQAISNIRNVKVRVRKVTGQAKLGEVDQEYKQLKAYYKAVEKGSKLGFNEGKREERERQQNMKKVNSLLKKLERLKKKVDKGTMLPEFATPLNDIFRQFDLKRLTSKKRIELENARAIMEEKGDWDEIDGRIKETVDTSRLDKTPIRDLSIDQMEDIVNLAIHINKLSIEDGKIRIAQEHMRMEDMRVKSVGEMKSRKDSGFDLKGNTEKGLFDIKGKLNAFLNYSLGFDVLVHRIGKATSVIQRLLVENLNKGVEKVTAYKQEVYGWHEALTEEFTKKLGRDVYGWLSEDIATSMMTRDIRNDEGQMVEQEVEITFTRGEIMSLLMHSRNVNNVRHLTQGGVLMEGHIDPVRFEEGELERLITLLDPLDLEYALRYDEIYVKQGEELGDVYHKMTGLDFVREKNYYPIEVVASERGGVETEDKVKMDRVASNYGKATVPSGMTKRRVQSRAGISLRRIDQVMNYSIQPASVYIGLALPAREAQKYMNDKEITREIKARYGKQTYQFLKKGVNDIIGIEKGLENIDSAFAWIRANFTTGILGANIPVMFKQTLSLQGYLPYIRSGNLIQQMSLMPYGKKLQDAKAFLEGASVQYKDRVSGGFNRDIRDWYKRKKEKSFKLDSADSVQQRLVKLREFFMSGISAFDQWAVTVGMMAAIEQTNEAIKLGGSSSTFEELILIATGKDTVAYEELQAMTADEKLQLGVKIGDLIVSRTQPMFSSMFRSTLSRGGETARTLTMFSSYRNRVFSQTTRLVLDAQRTGDSKPLMIHLFGFLFLNGIGATLINMAWSALRGSDDDKQSFIGSLAKGFISNAVAPIYFLTDILGGLFSGYDHSTPISDLFNLTTKVMRDMEKTFEEMFTGGDSFSAIGRTLNDLNRLFSQLSGLPMYNIFKNAKVAKTVVVGEDKKKKGVRR
jgi:hypothetical protein